MYKEILRGVENIGLYPTISFTIFFLFFLGLLTYIITANKEHVAHMSALPLEDETTLPNPISNQQQ
jgi:hypothetical protein